MDSKRNEGDAAPRPDDGGSGFALKSTRRGALVLQTENARRMMRRLAKLRSAPEPEPVEDSPTAPA